MKHIKDMREFLSALSDIGELQEIDLEVERDLEIGAIIRRAYDLRAPAPLFNNIKGVARGFRVLGGSAGVSAQKGLYLSRIAISLGFPAGACAKEIVNTLSDSMAKEGIPPRVLGTGVCQENVLTGDGIDLMKLQAPLLHMGDGGRYINTWGTVVVKTPDGKWTNWGIARVMLLDKNRMSGLIPPQQHLGIIHKMWSDSGEPTPFALALGC